MLLDAIASVILLAMMMVPLLNLVVAITVGAALAGLPGVAMGVLVAVAVTIAEKLVGERLGWFDIQGAGRDRHA
jgi:hypothetical protein